MPRVLKIIVTNLLILVILIFAIEIAIRIKGDAYTWTEKGQGIYVDPWSRVNNNPLQIRGTGQYQERYPEFLYDLEINEEGVRDIKHNVEKPLNTLRILGLGDSFMEGMGTDFDSTIMNLIERKAKAKYSSDVDFEALSGGVAGSDIFRAYNLLQERLIKYQPDYCLILFNNTDFNDWLIKGNEEGKLSEMSKPSKFERILFKYSHLYRSFTINVLHYSWLQQSPKEQKVLWKYFVQDFSKVIEKYIALMGSHDKVLFVYHPLIHEYEKVEYYLPFDELEALLKSKHIKTLDVLECFKSKDLISNSVYWKIDMHFNSAGYNNVAECIVEQDWPTP